MKASKQIVLSAHVISRADLSQSFMALNGIVSLQAGLTLFNGMFTEQISSFLVPFVAEPFRICFNPGGA